MDYDDDDDKTVINAKNSFGQEMTDGKMIPSLRVSSKVLLAQNKSFAT